MKEVILSTEAKNFLRKLDDSLRKRFKIKIQSLAKEEVRGIFLRKPLSNFQKVRVGSYRIIFQESSDNKILILYIEHRSDIYKKFISYFSMR